jgi:hypothetical protein
VLGDIFKSSRPDCRRAFDGRGGGWFSLFVWFFVRGLVVSLLCPLCLVGSPQAVAACPVSVWNTPFLSCPRDFCVGRGSFLSFYLYTLCGVSLSRFPCPLAGVLAILLPFLSRCPFFSGSRFVLRSISRCLLPYLVFALTMEAGRVACRSI